MTVIFYILFIILFVYLLIASSYLFIFSIAGKFYKPVPAPPARHYNNIAVLIPAYREDPVIISSVEDLLKQDYPAEHFKIFVGAHFLEASTLELLSRLPVETVLIKGDYGSKALTLQTILNQVQNDRFDIALILDADNHLAANGLRKINNNFESGAKAVQVHRMAKNMNNAFAIFDALAEEINNHLFRKGPSALGFSANTIGSGMAFGFNELKRIYNLPGIIYNPACDREVDYESMRNGISIAYIDDTYVLDEKVQSARVFTRQRTRWMESQWWHIKKFFSEKDKKVIYSKEFANKLFSNLLPSRVLMLWLFMLVIVLSIIDQQTGWQYIYPSFSWWLIPFLLFFLSLLIAIPYRMFRGKLLSVFLLMPSMMIYYVKSLLGVRSGRKHFEHTPKTFTGKKEQKH